MFTPDVNPDTNQTPTTIHQPDESPGVENGPSTGEPTQPTSPPDENIPPMEVPGRPETPEHIPEKSKKVS